MMAGAGRRGLEAPKLRGTLPKGVREGDPLARGRRRSHEVSGGEFCAVLFLMHLAMVALRDEREHYRRSGVSDWEATASWQFKGRAVFTTHSGTPLTDYILRRVWKRVTGAEGMGLPKEKQRPHKGVRGGGRTAMGAAGVSRKAKNIFAGWTEGSMVGEEVYETYQRSELSGLQAAM
jgi:hypothetical protein